MSTDASGANYTGEALHIGTSADGRYVLFRANLPGMPINAMHVKDRVTGAVTPASVATGSVTPVSTIAAGAFSADANCAAFITIAAVDPNDTNFLADVYVHDFAAGTTERASISSAGVGANAGSFHVSLSGDGRFVAFQSSATNLTSNDTTSGHDIFVRDRLSATTELVSVNASGSTGGANSLYPLISSDGRVVVFQSVANDLVLPDVLTTTEIYARDLITGTTSRVSVTPTGAQASGAFYNNDAIFPECGGISADGRFVAFVGDVGLDAAYPTFRGLYLRDRIAGTTRLVNVSPVTTGQFTDLDGGGITPDGRFVAYGTREKVTPDDANNQVDVFVRDMLLGSHTRISRELPGQLSGPFQNSGNATLSSDGATVVFESYSNHLDVADPEQNADIYAFDWGQLAPNSYCTAGLSSQGCVATLSASGNPSGSVGSGFTLLVSGADGQRSGLIVYGIGGRQVLPWGSSSVACVVPPRQRTGLLSSGGVGGACNGSFGLDWNAFVAANPFVLGAPFSALTPIQAQAFVRDPMSSGGSVLSDAIEFYAVP